MALDFVSKDVNMYLAIKILFTREEKTFEDGGDLQ